MITSVNQLTESRLLWGQPEKKGRGPRGPEGLIAMFAYKYLNLGFEHSSMSQLVAKNSLSLSQSAPSPSAWWRCRSPSP
jgi:hypothetical protein